MKAEKDSRINGKGWVRFNLQFEPTVKNELIRQAAKHRRTPSAQVAWLVEQQKRLEKAAA